MKTVLEILRKAGGYRRDLYLRIENPPYMALVIEAAPEPGPLGRPVISVAHYGEQNGDLMRDPEMCFEVSKSLLGNLELQPYYWRNDYLGVEQWSRVNRKGQYALHTVLFRQHEELAALWDRNLQAQRFSEAFTDRSIRS